MLSSKMQRVAGLPSLARGSCRRATAASAVQKSSPTPPDGNNAAPTSFKAAAVEPLVPEREAKPPITKPVEEPISIADKLLAELLPEDAEDVKEWWWITVSTFTFVYLAAAICKTYVELFTTAGATAFSTFP